MTNYSIHMPIWCSFSTQMWINNQVLDIPESQMLRTPLSWVCVRRLQPKRPETGRNYQNTIHVIIYFQSSSVPRTRKSRPDWMITRVSTHVPIPLKCVADQQTRTYTVCGCKLQLMLEIKLTLRHRYVKLNSAHPTPALTRVIFIKIWTLSGKRR